MGKLPALQFYPADWRKDPAVQSLSYFDRGVWFEILCLMHESDQRGKLLLNGKKMPDDALARLLGLDKQILTKTLTTLLEYGVASIDEETGALISRRMVRDEEIRKIRMESGKKGGNPILVNQNSNQNSTNGKKQVNQNSTPSSSSSVNSSSKEKELKGGGGSVQQTAAAGNHAQNGQETRADYLLRKQIEYPQLKVQNIYEDFKSKCGSLKYPNLKDTRQHFDNWLAIQWEEFPDDEKTGTSDVRAAIDDCSICDKSGFVSHGDGVKKCRHEKAVSGGKN